MSNLEIDYRTHTFNRDGALGVKNNLFFFPALGIGVNMAIFALNRSVQPRGLQTRRRHSGLARAEGIE